MYVCFRNGVTASAGAFLGQPRLVREIERKRKRVNGMSTQCRLCCRSSFLTSLATQGGGVRGEAVERSVDGSGRERRGEGLSALSLPL